MKNFFALTLATLSLTSFASTKADLVLRGEIQEILKIEIEQEEVASNLDLINGAQALHVATLTESSNHHTGYKILARSENAGKLVNKIDANSFVNYSLTYDGTNVPLTTSDNTVYSSQNLRGSFTKDLKITFDGDDNLSAGIYEDVVSFTIQAN